MKAVLLTLSACLLVVLPLIGQRDYDGCHFYKNIHPHPKPKKLSPAEAKLLQNSILRSDTIDILHYEIDIDVTRYTQQEITAATTITYTPLEPDRESILLDLYQLTVDSVKQGDAHLNFTYDGETLQVYFNETPQIGTEYEMTVWYQGEPHRDPFWGGFYFASNYIYNLGIGLTTIPPNFGKVWYPCFDTFLERATYTYHVTSAGGRVAVCQGDLFDEVQLGGDTLRRSFHLDTPIPTYLSAIAASNYDVHTYIHEGAYGDIDVQLAAQNGDLSDMIDTFQELGLIIDGLEYWWGPMIWSRVGYIYTTAGALEIPENIAYPAFMANENLNSNGELIAHELGHYWWGDVVTMVIHNDMWLKEGPAEYSAHLFYETRDGREGLVDAVKDNHLFVLERAHIDDEGFHPMSPMPDEHIYGRHTYNKGASVIHNLRAYLGDELFRQGMQAVQESMAFGNMTPQIFRDELMEATGYDLTAFFEDHILSPGFSNFVLDSAVTAQSGANFTTTLYMQQKLRECNHYYTNVPLEVTAMDANWVKHNFTVMVGDQYSTANITTDFDPVFVSLNSNGVLNQARMDYEFIVDDTSVLSNRPYVDMRTATDAINEGDSAFVRIEHHWVAPDNNNLAPYIDEVSSTHYWTIDGMWPESLQQRGRLSYFGANQSDLDYALTGFNENDLMLVYRRDASEPWVIHPDYTLQSGNNFDGNGQFVVHTFLPGQYSFANGDVAAAIESLEQTSAALKLWPVPASTTLDVAWGSDVDDAQRIAIVDASGREVLSVQVNQEKQKTLDISALPSGWYRARVLGARGRTAAAASFTIQR